ncbi:uncharacterized protein A1O9_05467 [Exophiala aquamarina CBS 119918]|uniref:GPI mannosyltransferase 2 n=1 Tax=Exophiala aquamarina CBS 119918 TaxID=1182545 RepID=A0A072PPV5_9EURO|nr:uncharacterized protein A1O9_05467 [Exophiala aquamarina CBS 119918]KEF57550.1 hypothetical protein A1O9_05467 [Exophiala aquamarina CBS 119918]
MDSLSTPQHQLSALFGLFLVWKSLILLIVFSSLAVGYDTSASLLMKATNNGILTETPNNFQSQWLKFVRWDAIYSTHMAGHGLVFEQEWAWGIGLSTSLSFLAKRLAVLTGTNDAVTLVIAGVLLSHTTHWLSTVQLWFLARRLVDVSKSPKSQVPFCAAAFYIISPAGVFLSAPYSESLFAFLSISGFLGYVYAVHYFNHARVFAGSVLMVAAGVPFGLATFVRGNGILAGVTYLLEAAATVFALLTQEFTIWRLIRLSSVAAGGLLVAVGTLIPQYLAYTEYCLGRDPEVRRPWCNNTMPSIFTFVQSHYWNVGPFRYWTLSNLPLFLLAAPSLWLLAVSSTEFMRNPRIFSSSPAKATSRTVCRRDRVTAWSLALPQLILAILALTSYHVQIITRLASGYPLWYIWLSHQIVGGWSRTSVIIRYMVMYGLIQAGLYASFLPPA